jgi:RNA polymerase sigma factor (sigma-70 family)
MKSSTGTDAIPYEIVPTDTLDRDFDRLLAANGPALGRLAASYTNTLSDRDDLLQEIALAVWQALRTFRGECSERTFLFRIAHNRAIAYLSRTRSQVSETVDEMEVHDPAPQPRIGTRTRTAGRTPAVRHSRTARPLRPSHHIDSLLEDLTYGEIAEVLGISESNVGVRLTRARQLLREVLEKQK